MDEAPDELGFDALMDAAEKVRTAEDLGAFIATLVAEGRRDPQPSYWQWNVDHLYLESAASQLASPAFSIAKDGPAKTVAEAFRQVARAFLVASIHE